MKFAAMIAAAGTSSRMGMPKALCHINGKPAISFLAEQFARACDCEIFITLPDEMIASLRPWSLPTKTRVLANRFHHLGYFGSIKTVVEHCHDLDGLFITPVDVPACDVKLIRTMALVLSLRSTCVVVPHFFHCAGHPVLLSRHFFKEILEWQNSGGLRGFICEHEQRRCALMWPDAYITGNINSASDRKNAANAEFAATPYGSTT